VTPHLPFQPSLLAGEPAGFDRSFEGLARIRLDTTSWVDHAPGLLRGSDEVFGEVLADRRWAQRWRWMHGNRVLEPRLTDRWSLGAGEPLLPAVLDALRLALGARYGVTFDSAGFNLYRDGRDGVAWHADRIRKEIAEPVIALVSLGEPRTFLLRPKGGGSSIPFRLGRGDLLVTGGTTNGRWEHCVPKVARAGPRISLAYRHGLDPRGYGKVGAGSRSSSG
jgi:alkylated DNA repair dioxygenase AlkB